MADDITIQRFLDNNSGMTSRPIRNRVVQATARTKYRPDRIFERNETMKWNMIYNGIDTPHRMAERSVFINVDPTWLKTELDGLDDFEI